MLIRNKCDCEDSKRKVTKERVALAKEFGVPFSRRRKSGLRVEEAFSAIARRCVGESKTNNNNSNNSRGGGTVRLRETARWK